MAKKANLSDFVLPPKKEEARDLSSLSNPHQVRVKHLQWSIKVDFEKQILSGSATYTLERREEGTTLDLDTSKLLIHAVTDKEGNKLSYKLLSSGKAHLGTKLSVSLATPDCKVVVIQYATQPGMASALQFLQPAQTAGKVRPYLFTQCQAIHARSILPCQDCPGVKMTYHASVSVPAWSVCVMSAVLVKVHAPVNDWTLYEFTQSVPISSYLLALAVGDLVKLDLSDRCAVWSEPAIVKAAAYEFAQTDDFLKTAEKIAGMPYQWGRYDLLCLPPSFPYGGMENPCLTFCTPTLLAGDRSLADVVAHEIAHSWTGNGVTNASWDHFWLNEGWTTWFQRKIMQQCGGEEKNATARFDFDALGGQQGLEQTVKTMPPEFTKLVLNIRDGDPDESYSRVAYEKGFFLLLALERRVGSDAFEGFFQAYLKTFSSKTLDSQDFQAFCCHYFRDDGRIDGFDWTAWFHEPGMPPEPVTLDKSLAKAAEHLADQWLAANLSDRTIQEEQPWMSLVGWSTNQKTYFLDTLFALTEQHPLKTDTLTTMDAIYKFSSSKNAEILFRYCLLAIRARDDRILPVTVAFITSQGRMKYVRPLYKALYESSMGREVAVRVFLQHQDSYHPICTKMIAADLRVRTKSPWWRFPTPSLVTVAAVAAILAVAWSKRK